MSTTTVPSSTVLTPATSAPAALTGTTYRVPTWLHRTLAVVAGAVATGAFEALTRAAGVPYDYGLPGTEPATMPASGLFFAVLEVGIIGIILAACLTRWARQPRSTWYRTTVTLTLISLVPSLIAASTTYATNIALAASHLIAAAVIIPMCATRLAERNPRPT
jgi:hypothetical protein